MCFSGMIIQLLIGRFMELTFMHIFKPVDPRVGTAYTLVFFLVRLNTYAISLLDYIKKSICLLECSYKRTYKLT